VVAVVVVVKLRLLVLVSLAQVLPAVPLAERLAVPRGQATLLLLLLHFLPVLQVEGVQRVVPPPPAQVLPAFATFHHHHHCFRRQIQRSGR
jgi:hypothetical protein